MIRRSRRSRLSVSTSISNGPDGLSRAGRGSGPRSPRKSWTLPHVSQRTRADPRAGSTATTVCVRAILQTRQWSGVACPPRNCRFSSIRPPQPAVTIREHGRESLRPGVTALGLHPLPARRGPDRLGELVEPALFDLVPGCPRGESLAHLFL